MKTTTLVIETYKDTGLREQANDLGFCDGDLFEYGEYIKRLEVEIDENFNVIGGKLTPFKTPVRKLKDDADLYK